MPSRGHEEIVANISKELVSHRWKKVSTNYRPHFRWIRQGLDADGPHFGSADAMFEKDGEYVALEVGYIHDPKFRNLIKAIRLGRFGLLCVSFSGRIVLFDKSNSFFEDLGHSLEQPADVWFRRMGIC
mgnify:FL=1